MEAEAGALTIVVDNVSLRQDLQSDWGFACHIALPQGRILFDTGADGPLLLRNLAQLDLDPERIGHVVLSHIHDDHCGGLEAFLSVAAPSCTVVVPDAFPGTVDAFIASRGGRCERVREARALLPGVHTTGEMGRGIREQGLVVESPSGLVVVTGCAHPGIEHMVERTVARFNQPVRLLMGGFHLMDQPPSSVRAVSKRLEELGVEGISPGHCTGDDAKVVMRDCFGERGVLCGAGLRVSLA